MAVGFVCADGVVIGSDRQITARNYTFPDCKILPITWENGAGIWAFSGTFDLQKLFASEVWSRFSLDQTIQEHEVSPKWKQCLDALDFTENDQLTTLFGYLTSAGTPKLLMSTPEKRVLPVARAEVIGYADSPLSRSLLGRYFSDSMHGDH